MSANTDDKNGLTQFRIAVNEEFSTVFSHFYVAENYSEQAVTRTLLPSYQTLLAFNFGTAIRLLPPNEASVVSGNVLAIGPVKQAFNYTMPQNSKLLVVNLKNDAFFRFFGTAEVAERFAVNPDELIGIPCFSLLWQTLNLLPDVNQQINHILAFCRPYLKGSSVIASQLSEFNNDNFDPIKSIALKHRLTERHIQLQHQKHLGYSAKAHHRYKRFLKATEIVSNHNSIKININWLQIVADCGYYDQSQLIKDFKYYLNLTPKQYARQQHSICTAR